MKKILCTLLFTGTLLSGLSAQQSILSTSKDAEGSNGSVSYSVGQTAYLTKSGISGLIIEGVQQPYEIQFFPGVDERKENELKCSVYPNPTSGEVTLKIEQQSQVSLQYKLADIRGNILSEQPVENCPQTIPMESFSSGTYFLTILEKETILKTYKIIKR